MVRAERVDVCAQVWARQTLTQDGTSWRITDPDGTVWEFDMTRKVIQSMTTPGGQVTEYDWDDTNGRFTQSIRTVGSNVEKRTYDYDSSGPSVQSRSIREPLLPYRPLGACSSPTTIPRSRPTRGTPAT